MKGQIKKSNEQLPIIILGEDSFSGWFKKSNITNKKRAENYKEILDLAYSKGIKGFMCSTHKAIRDTLKEFKKIHADITCIANPQWYSYYYYYNQSLWVDYYRNKCIATINKIYGNLDPGWLKGINVNDYFNKNEIKNIHLNENDVYNSISDLYFCDYFIIGNLWYDFLYYTERTDIIEQEIKIINKLGKEPIALITGGELPLLKLENLNVSKSFIWLNRYRSFPNLKETEEAVKTTDIELAAYRVFENKNEFSISGSLNYLSNFMQVKSVVIGVDNLMQAKETFAKAVEIYENK
ncbi:MAG: hypothetical protein GY756_02645 [bacterium]|nr:hypothetical protein [bacterium]